MLDAPITDPSDRVVIVGASLAGLLSALAIARTGRDVTVVERAPRDRPSGAALVVDERQLHETIGRSRAATATRRLGADPRRPTASLRVTWQGLHDGLHDAADEDPAVTVLHDRRVREIEQHERGASVTTDDGLRVEGAAVIGADGHRSIVRRAIVPEHPDATFARYVLWLGVGEEASMTGLLRWPHGSDIRPAGEHYLLSYPLPDPDGIAAPGRRRLGWAWYDSTRNELFRRSGSVQGEVAHHSLKEREIPEATYAELADEARARLPSPWREAVLDSIDRRAVVGSPIKEYVPVRLAAGRLAIVGDAAHVPTPMTGSGFDASVEDAAALGLALDPVAGLSVPESLLRYERERLADAQMLVRGGQSFSRSFGARR